MKIFAGYKPTDKPWGGANNFLRALYSTLEKNYGYEIVFEPHEDCDLFFFCQLGKGPANNSELFSLADLKEISDRNPFAPCVMRMVNLRGHTSHRYRITYLLNKHDRKSDAAVRDSSKICDHIIFQSEYQKTVLSKFGIRTQPSTVIHNGAAEIFSRFTGRIPTIKDGERLKIFSSAVSTKGWKNHEVIAAFSQCQNVDIFYAGVWPENIQSNNVKLLGKLDHASILEVALKSHYFLHPGEREACSNSVIEALSMGLPVLHYDSGSSPEIVGDFGIIVHNRNLEKQIATARERQPHIALALNEERHKFSMDTAATKYHQTFLQAIQSKKAGA